MSEGPIRQGLSVLIVDDEANIRKTLAYCLEEAGHAVVAVSNAADAEDLAKRRVFDMAFVDLRLGQADGMALIGLLRAQAPWIHIVVITAYATIETAVEAIRKGALDYVAKPFMPDQIRLLAARVAHLRRLESENATLRQNLGLLDPDPVFDSRSTGMQKVLDTARRAAASEAVLLLRGESGTGKSSLVRAIHGWSSRAQRPLGIVSCPAVPPDLLESELFGHVKGAFTSAVRDNPGRIAACEGGTLFLDEIADLAPPVQAKLLHFIQTRSYERLGDPAVRTADVRLIVATNADLEQRLADGRFREDLFYRLSVIPIVVPPLRDRRDDVLPLAEQFLDHFCRINHKGRKSLSDEAAAALLAHAWPGNVRELRNAIERAVILGTGDRVERSDFPDTPHPPQASPAPGDRISLARLEELHIRRVIATASSLQEAADILGIDQATLWRRRKAYGI